MNDRVIENDNIPSDWHRELVGTAFDMQLGKMLSKASKTGRNSKPYLGNKNVQWDRVDLSDLETMDFTESEQDKFALQPGDLLVCEGGEVGRTAMWHGELVDCYYQKAIHRLRPKSGTIEPAYMLRFMRLAAMNGWLTNFTSQSSIAHLTREKLAVVPMAAPPLPQQRKIAKILTTVDNLIEKTEALIAKYQAVKQGMMHDLFTRGVDEHGHLRPTYDEAPELYKDSELGWIPKEWEVTTLDQVAEVNRGKFTARPRNDPKFYGGPFPFIQTGDITNNLGRYLTTYSQTLNRLGTTVSKGFPAGAILVTIAANIADTAILGMPMYLPDSIVGVVVGPACVVRFVELAIRRRKHSLDALAPQSAQKNINLEDLRPLNIPLPAKDEQQKIADIYESFDEQIARETAYVEKLRSQKTGLMQDLLTGKVRVKVDDAEEATE